MKRKAVIGCKNELRFATCDLLYIYRDREIYVVIFLVPIYGAGLQPTSVKKIRIPILSLAFFSKRMLVFEIMIIYSVMKP